MLLKRAMPDIDWLPPLITALIGLVSGWSLSELTDWRRRVREQRELRRALVAELEHGEVLASHNVVKYARFVREDQAKVAFVAKEIRWFQTSGRRKLENSGVLDDLPPTPAGPGFEALDAQRLVDLFAARFNEAVGTKLVFPIVESALAGKTAGFSAEQIAALGMVHWHAHLLSQNADAMREFLHMSFTIMDDNHPRILENHTRQCSYYALRSEVLLRVIRRAIHLLRQ